MSQNLKQNALGHKMLQRFCRSLLGLGMAVILWNSSLFIPLAQADYYEANFIDGSTDALKFNTAEKQSVNDALAYINSLVSTGADDPTHYVITVKKEYEDNDKLASALNNNISINTKYTFSYEKPSQIALNNGSRNLTSILYHEMGHNLGITDTLGQESGSSEITLYYWDIPFVDRHNYNEYEKHLFYSSTTGMVKMVDTLSRVSSANVPFEYNTTDGKKNGIFTFQSTNVNYVYNDGGDIEQYLQVENGQSYRDNNGVITYPFRTVDPSSSIYHPYTYHGIMNAINQKTNRPFFSEVELAVLKDVGRDIDLKEHFGQSYYLSHGEITNTNGFDSSAMYGVGLHIIAANNQVTQAANIYANGEYATGIYSEGNNNAVTINPGVTVSATGEGGIGVLFIYNEDYELDEYGNIKIGENGKAVKKDNKARFLTNMGTIQGDKYGIYIDKGLKTINNTGTITANTNAITISDNGIVTNINFMGNSQINGNIEAVMDNGIKNLNFGKIAKADGTPDDGNDPSFNGTVNGNITATQADMNMYGGNLKLTGETWIQSLDVRTGATVDGNGSGSLKLQSFNEQANLIDNSGTVKNFISINAYGFTNRGDLSNVTTISLNSFENNGNINNVSAMEVSDSFYNYGDMNNVSMVSSNQIYNMGVGSMTNVSTVSSNQLLNNGNITVGEAGAIDTMNVEGYMQNNDGTLTFDANLQARPPISGTTDDLLAVKKNGTAGDNDGKLVINDGQININELNSTGSSYYRADINHNIIETEEGVEVKNELKAKESGFDIPLFKPVIGYDDKNVWVGLQRDFLYGPAAQTGNQAAIGYYLDEIGKTPNPEGDLFPVLLQLDALNEDKETGIVSNRALHALEEMSGAVYGTATSLANQHSTMINSSLAKHLRQWSPCEVMGNNWNIWAEAYGMGGNAVQDGNANGYNYSAAGTLIGIDRQFNFDGHLGVYFAAGSTDANVKGPSESAISTDIFAGLYLNFKDTMGWYTTMFAGLGHSDYEVKRHFTFIPRNNKGSFDIWQFNAYIERGKNFSISDVWVFQPFGGLQFINSDREAIQENGADLLDLSIAGTNIKSLRSLFGIKLATVNCVTKRKLNGEISAAWMHEYLDTYSIVSAQMSNPGGAYFESSPTYTVQGHNDGRDWLVAGIGLNYSFTDFVKLYGGYDCMVNGVGALHRGNLGLEIRR